MVRSLTAFTEHCFEMDPFCVHLFFIPFLTKYTVEYTSLLIYSPGDGHLVFYPQFFAIRNKVTCPVWCGAVD